MAGLEPATATCCSDPTELTQIEFECGIRTHDLQGDGLYFGERPKPPSQAGYVRTILVAALHTMVPY